MDVAEIKLIRAYRKNKNTVKVVYSIEGIRVTVTWSNIIDGSYTLLDGLKHVLCKDSLLRGTVSDSIRLGKAGDGFINHDVPEDEKRVNYYLYERSIQYFREHIYLYISKKFNEDNCEEI